MKTMSSTSKIVKKIVYPLLSTLLMACTITLASCKDNDDDPLEPDVAVELTLESASVSVEEGASKTVNITKGNGGYSASSTAEGVATASISGNSVQITGVAVGTATVTVKDKANKSATLSVTVTAADSGGDDKVTLTLSLEAIFDEESGAYTPLWTDGDQIGVFIGSEIENESFTGTASNEGQSATFTKSVELSVGTHTVYAYHPWVDLTPVLATEVPADIKNVQAPGLTSFDGNADLLVAQSKSIEVSEDQTEASVSDMRFSRLSGLLSLKLPENTSKALKNEPVGKVTVTATTSDGSSTEFILSGKCGIDLIEGELTQFQSEQAYNYVTAIYDASSGFNPAEHAVNLFVNPITIPAGSVLQIDVESAAKSIRQEITLIEAVEFEAGSVTTFDVPDFEIPVVVYMDDDLEWLTTLYEGAGKTIGDFLNDQSKTSMAAWDTNLGQHGGWERDGNRTYIGKGYFRCNTGDNTGTLKSPYLTEIGSETVNVLVQIEVAKWITSGEVGSGEITVTVSGSGTINGGSSINIVADNTAWNEFVTKEFTITGAKSDTRLLITASHLGKNDVSNPEKKNPQFMFGGIKVIEI